MFCHKCGTQIDEEAAFCYKCGTKVVHMDTKLQASDEASVPAEPEKISAEPPVQGTPMESVQAAASAEGITDYGTDFKTFVNNHVRQTTKFQSAEELLNSHVSQKFMWICFGIPAIIGLVAAGPVGALLFGLFFGYPTALLTDFMKGSHVNVTGPIEKIDGKIAPDNLIQFLNEQMRYLSPHFHEWDYINYRGSGVRGAVTAHTLNSITASAAKIGTEFGRKQRCFVVIWIEPDETNPDSGRMKYYFRTSAKSVWPSKYLCMVKTVPILQAVMKYYLKNYGGGSNNVLS